MAITWTSGSVAKTVGVAGNLVRSRLRFQKLPAMVAR